ncbi:vomeronasal type-2 receptor 26-like [Xenopus tropicalis]|uniref:Vomeronasal type-2 receptor 26-like n=1 Tax=Xenopus tropicalis TaxID=8364 RepID=A0A8J1IPQ8_XENTR|nr:vomeronasal type-2 receptor 26-like [Xenopus tropicalis]
MAKDLPSLLEEFVSLVIYIDTRLKKSQSQNSCTRKVVVSSAVVSEPPSIPYTQTDEPMQLGATCLSPEESRIVSLELASEDDVAGRGTLGYKEALAPVTRYMPGRNCAVICPSISYYQHYLAAIFAIEEINQNANILPNLTLGYRIYDACTSESRAAANTLSILTGRAASVPNYSCNDKGTLAAFVGHLLPTLTHVVSDMTTIYRFPQVSYGAQDPALDDRQQYPTFYRTIINEKYHFVTINQILKLFGWTWVGIIYSDDESHQRAANKISSEITTSGGCVEFMALYTTENLLTISITIDKIRRSSANVIIISSNSHMLLHIVLTIEMTTTLKKHLLFSSSLENMISFAYSSLNGSLIISGNQGAIPGFKEFFYTAHPTKFPNDEITALLWLALFCCLKYGDNSSGIYIPACTMNDTLSFFGMSFYAVINLHITYNMYIAVYALAHALHKVLYGEPHEKQPLESELQLNLCKIQMCIETWLSAMVEQLNNHLKSIHFQTSSGDEIFFNEHGEVQGNLEIENWISYPNETTAIRKVGTFNSSAPPGEQLLINKPDIIWGTPLNDIPQSVCIGTCQPGYRKAGIKGLPACCYECVQCSDGEIANVSDMENCIRCQEDEWSNEKKNKCIKKTIDFLSYAEPLGLSLAMLAILLSITASIVLGIFIRNRQSQIVKANNQELSYSLLLTIILSFLCTLLFIGKPKKVTCLLRQITFAVIFTISISSVLVKTMTVLIAFHAITPGSMLKILVRKSVSRCFILVFSLGEVIICIMWFLHCPPFPDYDTRSSVMTLQCNEGSAVAFYIAVGYIGMLASVSFITAYLARGLPDIFNEASHITFSMLVFCCVWITFIPAYISSKGKYMVAVEIFAILSSSSGLLGFIFLPKCYIILLKPEMNVKGKGTSKKK